MFQPMLTFKAVQSFTVLMTFTLFAAADTTAEESSWTQQYQNLIEAEHQWLEAKLTLETQRQNTLQQLWKKGHASWLEQRRQQLAVDKLAAQLRAYGQFRDAATALTGFAETANAPKVFSTIRLKFTALDLERAQRHPLAEHSRGEQDIADLRQELLAAQQRRDKLAKQHASLHETDPWKPGFQLRHAVAVQECIALKARIDLAERLEIDKEISTANRSADLDTGRPARLTSEARRSSIDQCRLHGQLIQHNLDYEQRRQEVLEEWAQQGMATSDDRQRVVDRIEQLMEFQRQQTKIARYLERTEPIETFFVSQVDSLPGARADSVSDSKNVWRSLRHRFEECEAEFCQNVARLEKEMNTEILKRLKLAARVQTGPSTAGFSDRGLESALATGQQREIDNYRWRIRLHDLELQLATAHLASLRTPDSHRTIDDQFVVHYPQPQWHADLSATFFGLTRFGLLAATPLLVSDVGDNPPAISASWLEHRYLDLPPFRFTTDNANYRPVRLIDFRESMLRYRPRSAGRPAVNRLMNLGRSDLGRTPSKPLILSDGYRIGHELKSTPNRLPKIERAYRYGILRSDLRSKLPPGHVPWYLPGSPTNLKLH